MTKEGIHGFVLVNSEPPAESAEKRQACDFVLYRLKETPGVKDAYKTSNPGADFVVFIEANSVANIQKILERIREIPGVKDITTKIEMPA